jgi:hypothetical protein
VSSGRAKVPTGAGSTTLRGESSSVLRLALDQTNRELQTHRVLQDGVSYRTPQEPEPSTQEWTVLAEQNRRGVSQLNVLQAQATLERGTS